MRGCILHRGTGLERKHDAFTAQGKWVPTSCTLPTLEQPIRVAEFDQFFTVDFTTSTEGVVMGVGVPPSYIEVLDAFAARVQAAMTSQTQAPGTQ